MRLNGWVRLGIVASVLWALVMSWVMLDYANDMGAASGNFARNMCQLDNEQNGTSVDCGDKWMEAFLSERNYQLWGIPLVALAPLPFFWLFAWLIIIVCRWVARGFKREPQ